jgi:ribonuclease P protein component
MAGAREQRGRRLPRERRITRGAEIREVFRRGRRSRTRHLDVLDSDSPASFARVGVVVPRHGHGAVERNGVKRRLREVLRRELVPHLDGVGARRDVLVRARPEAYSARYADFATELEEWARQRWPGSS